MCILSRFVENLEHIPILNSLLPVPEPMQLSETEPTAAVEEEEAQPHSTPGYAPPPTQTPPSSAASRQGKGLADMAVADMAVADMAMTDSVMLEVEVDGERWQTPLLLFFSEFFLYYGKIVKTVTER